MLLNRFPEWKQWFMSILLVSSPTVAAPSYPAQPKGFFLMMRHGGGCCGGRQSPPGQSAGGIGGRRNAGRASATRGAVETPTPSNTRNPAATGVRRYITDNTD